MRKPDWKFSLWTQERPEYCQKLVEKHWEISTLTQKHGKLAKSIFMLTLFSDIILKVLSSLLTMLCQCMFDACCLATIFEWIFLDDPLTDLTLVDLGACHGD